MPKSYNQIGKIKLFIKLSGNLSFFISMDFCYIFQNTVFEKKTVQLLVQSTEKFLCAMRNLGTKTYPKYPTLRSFF